MPLPLIHQSWSTGWNEKWLNGSTMKDQSDNPSHHDRMLLPHNYISFPGGVGCIIIIIIIIIIIKCLFKIFLLNFTKEGNVIFNNTLNTFYLRLYGVRHMVKDHSDSEKKPTAATWATFSN